MVNSMLSWPLFPPSLSDSADEVHTCTNTWHKPHHAVFPGLVFHSWGMKDHRCCVLQWLKDKEERARSDPETQSSGSGLVSFMYETWPVSMLGYFSLSTIFKVPCTLHMKCPIQCVLLTSESLGTLNGKHRGKVREESRAHKEPTAIASWGEQATGMWIFLSLVVRKFSWLLISVHLHQGVSRWDGFWLLP